MRDCVWTNAVQTGRTPWTPRSTLNPQVPVRIRGRTLKADQRQSNDPELAYRHRLGQFNPDTPTDTTNRYANCMGGRSRSGNTLRTTVDRTGEHHVWLGSVNLNAAPVASMSTSRNDHPSGAWSLRRSLASNARFSLSNESCLSGWTICARRRIRNQASAPNQGAQGMAPCASSAGTWSCACRRSLEDAGHAAQPQRRSQTRQRRRQLSRRRGDERALRIRVTSAISRG